MKRGCVGQSLVSMSRGNFFRSVLSSSSIVRSNSPISCYIMSMSRRFNVSGRCRPDEHYMLPPLRRIPTVRSLVDRNAYFVLHAPRQMGKTTSLLTSATIGSRRAGKSAAMGPVPSTSRTTR